MTHTERAQVCVVASFMYDMVATAPRRPAPGETLVGTGFATFVGGKGFNQAVAAARAGARTAAVGRVGEDHFATEFRDFMSAEGIDAAGVASDAENGTGVGLPVVVEGGQNSIIIVPRANEAVTTEDVEGARATIESADVLLLQLEIPLPAVRLAAEIARGAGTRVVLNPAPFVDVPREILDLVDVLVPNEVELGQLVPGEPDLADAALALRRSSGCVVVVTCGSAGVLVVDSDAAPRRLDAHRVEVVDTIGAGDAFCGNLAARLALGDDLDTAIGLANAAGALSVTRPGGAPSAPTAAETARLAAVDPVQGGPAQVDPVQVEPVQGGQA
ncbi:ribokinase [Georgenia sp. Z1344]|uniref:ribokinase n=1 Tax=Georgenia sp. Z1344 TaxID=3416706 RepID=UPI003CF013DF